jgi:hypothetical protein
MVPEIHWTLEEDEDDEGRNGRVQPMESRGKTVTASEGKKVVALWPQTSIRRRGCPLLLLDTS